MGGARVTRGGAPAVVLALALAPLAGPTLAQEPAAGSHLLVVSGLSGEPAYADAFHEVALRLVEASEAAGLPRDRITWLAEDPARAPDRIAARSTRDDLAAALEEVAGSAGANDVVLLFLIGHGGVRDGESSLALPGPDLTGAELAGMLDPLEGRRVAVVNAASASGGFVPALAEEGRVVITATRSASERNATRFGEFFADALAGEGADTDKDGRISLLEAFEYARREVARSYEAENRLQTEHALLEDDGDGKGSLEPDPAGGDGRLAGRLFLAPGAAAAALPADPELAALLRRRERLEREVDELKSRKGGMEESAYERRLEELLVELALTSREIRAREESADPEDSP